MNTVAQIVDEYKNRQAEPKYEVITVNDNIGSVKDYINVNHIQQVQDDGTWLEFDSRDVDSRDIECIRHIRIFEGHITKYIEVLYEQSRTNDTIPDCIYIDIYINSGDTQHTKDVQNLHINSKDCIVEYDQTIDGNKTHTKMSGNVTKYVERIYD